MVYIGITQAEGKYFLSQSIDYGKVVRTSNKQPLEA